jgi:hypothetical protein
MSFILFFTVGLIYLAFDPKTKENKKHALPKIDITTPGTNKNEFFLS